MICCRKVVSIKFAVILAAFVCIIGCIKSSEAPNVDNTSLKNSDLSGTWLHSEEAQKYNASTGEYLSSTFSQETYIFEEADRGVKFERCWEYGRSPKYGIKTDDRFSFWPKDIGFALNSDNILEQVSEHDYEQTHYKIIETLTRIAYGPVIDSGTLILNGPISVEEYKNVCINRISFSNTKRVKEKILIQVPFHNSHLTLIIAIHEEILPEIYQYTNPSDQSPVKIEVSSFSNQYYNLVGSQRLISSNISIEIIDYNDKRITGTFRFLGKDNGNYSGAFEAIF